MKLSLDDDQLSIKESASRFFREVSPVSVLRRLRDQRDPRGYDPAIWQQMAELGFTGLTIAEDHGGLGLGYATLGAVFEEAGRRLCASPLFASLVLGASTIELAGPSPQQGALLESIAAGRLTLALALEEGHHHSARHISCRAARTDQGYVMNGRKTLVLDGGTADRMVVVARTAGAEDDEDGLSLFLMDGAAPGLTRTGLELVDSRNAAALNLENVIVPAEGLLGAEGRAFPVLQQVLDRANAILAAEMLGGTLELFERTLAYLREREQFGVKIGTFQALKHRAARMFIEIELLRSAVAAALAAVDDASDQCSLLVSLAKSRANDVYQLVSNESVQMHGGIGVTDDLDVGLFLKRSRVATQCFGDSRFHRNRFATLHGY